MTGLGDVAGVASAMIVRPKFLRHGVGDKNGIGIGTEIVRRLRRARPW